MNILYIKWPIMHGSTGPILYIMFMNKLKSVMTGYITYYYKSQCAELNNEILFY